MVNIYLDIDGVILANDKQPALHANEFIGHIVERFPVYWLTTHCRNLGDDPVPMLTKFFDEETVKHLQQIRPSYWDMLKTEAIDFDQPFRWFDDDVFPEEQEVLKGYGRFDSWVSIDLAQNPHQLREYLKPVK